LSAQPRSTGLVIYWHATMSLLIALILLAAIFVVVMNWVYFFMDFLNARRGIRKHVSMVFLVPQILVMLAWFLATPDSPSWFPSGGYAAIALADISFLSLIFISISILWRAISSRK
jgi:hypothetical protein